jgi:phosphoserine phosphatase RsbU/P
MPTPQTTFHLGEDIDTAPHLPRWLGRKALRLIFLIGVVVLWGITATLAWFQWRSFERQVFERLVLFSRVLSDQTERTLESIEQSLRTQAAAMEKQSLQAPKHPQLREAMQSSLTGFVQVRSLSITDEAGRIVVSSDPRNEGKRVQLRNPGSRTDDLQMLLGPWVAGRDWHDAKAAKSDFRQQSTLPLSQSFKDASGTPRYLVAAFNLDFLSNQHALLLGGSDAESILMAFDGTVLVSQNEALAQVGQSRSFPAILDNHSPIRDFGSYTDDSTQVKRLTSFRALRKYPMLTIAQAPHEQVLALTWRSMRGVVIFAGLINALWVLVFWLANRSLRSYGKMNKALKLSERSNSALMRASIDGIVIVDLHGRILSTNPAAAKWLHRTTDELHQQSIYGLLIPQRHQSDHHQQLLTYMQSGQSAIFNQRKEFPILNASGHEVSAEVTLVPVTVGSSIYGVISFRDLTDRLRTEKERADLLRDYRQAALDLSSQKLAMDQHAMVLLADAQMRVRNANPTFLSVTGYALKDLRGMTLDQVIALQSPRGTVIESWREACTNGRVWHGELKTQDRTGQTLWLSSTIVPLYGENGEVREYMAIHTNVSALRLAELELEWVRERELAIGTRIQKSLLIDLPDWMHPRLWLASRSMASQGIDGDFVEILPMGKNAVDVVVGDVMGKGIAAALMGAAVKMKLNRVIAEELSTQGTQGRLASPALIVQDLHDRIAEHLQALDVFVTLMYLRIDSAAQQITWVGCGHEPAMLVTRYNALSRLENQHPPLGVLPGMTLVQDSCPMLPGEKLLLYSDGVTDAINEHGQRQGHDNLAQALRECVQRHETPGLALHALQDTLLGAHMTITDDASLLLVSMQDGQDATTCHSLLPQLDQVRVLRRKIESVASAMGWTDATLSLCTVACVEAFTNIVRHGLDLPKHAPIEVLTRCDAERLQITFVYLGAPFDMTDGSLSKELDFDTLDQDWPEGGFGLHIIQSVCSELNYTLRQGVNHLRLVFESPR